MAIQPSELKFYKSAVITDTGTNGGILSAVEVSDTVFPEVSQAERAGGVSRLRKLFCKLTNADNLSLIGSRIYLERGTPGQDRVTLHAGTATNVQSELTGNERLYGVGTLNADASAGASSIVLDAESTDGIFADGDLIRISNQDGVNDQTGKEEWIRLANPTGAVWNGSQVTLNFLYGSTLANNFLASNTRISSAYESGTLTTSKGFWLKQTVPAGAQSISANAIRIAVTGQSS